MSYRSIISLMPKTAALDPDAQAFLTAAGIVDPTISGAINTLVVQMKADNIWTKMKAIYPMVGGTASTHKWNLKDPRDLDAAFRLSFSGGITHDSNGIQGNGVNGYANTFLNDSTVLSVANKHISAYSRTNSAATLRDMGVLQPSVSSTNISARWSDLNTYFSVGGSFVSAGNLSNSLGLFMANKIVSGQNEGYKNGVLVGSSASTVTNVNIPHYLLAMNNLGNAEGFSSRQYSLFSLGDGLTPTEAANFYTAVQAFQTTLNRQV